MKNFTYYRPGSTDEAVGLLDSTWGTAELLAGGTDLHDLQKEYVAQPEKVVSLTGIKGFADIEVLEKEPPTLVLGAGVTLADIAAHGDLQKYCPSLTVAAANIGGPQIRNMGTLGGNLCQRNRCWYFRDEHTVCLLKGGEKCFALDGDNRYHAVFTQGHPCVIVSPSTLAPALVALGATAEVLGPKGKRTVELARFFRAPRSEKEREHVLEPNELVLSVSFPVAEGAKNAIYEVRHKQSYDWPVAAAAVAFKLDGGKARNVRIVLGHVGPTPIVATEAARALEGQTVNEGAATEAGSNAAKGAKPLAHNGYKVRLIEVAVKRAVLTAAGHEKYWEV
jgi:xanthine dehydrogenase YagS FAD-binding subunit